MQRRDFISCAAASSVCALAPAAVAQEPAAKKRQKKNNCKTTGKSAFMVRNKHQKNNRREMVREEVKMNEVHHSYSLQS